MRLIELVAHVVQTPGWRWHDFVAAHAPPARLLPLLAWTGIALLAYVALWPAMWVAPRDTLAQVMDISGDYAEQGHSSPVFYAGRIVNGDPGTWFYPVNTLWRLTPIVLAGLLLLLPALIWRSEVLRPRHRKYVLLGLALWVFFFIVFMNLGAKKFDRYSCPSSCPWT